MIEGSVGHGARRSVEDERLLSLVAALRRPPSEVEFRWLTCLWRMAEAGEAAAVPLAGTAAGRLSLSRGKGGDVTVELDRAAEEAMLEVLATEAPADYRVTSEEVGERGERAARWHVLMDPVDGSLNAKRGLEPFGCTLALASGPQLGDIGAGIITDYARGHRFLTVRGCGLASTRMVQPPQGAGGAAGQVELILTEMGRPSYSVFSFREMGLLAGWHETVALSLEETPTTGGEAEDLPDFRVRQMGSVALALALTSLGVADVLFCPAPARPLDIAAGLLMVREAGGGAQSLNGSDLWGEPLDLARRAPFVAWRAGLDGGAIVARARRLWHLKHP